MLEHHPKRSDKFMQDTNRKSCEAYSISSADYWTHHSSLDCLVFLYKQSKVQRGKETNYESVEIWNPFVGQK